MQISMSVMKALILVLVTECVLILKEVLVALVSLLRYCQQWIRALLVSNSHSHVHADAQPQTFLLFRLVSS